MTQRRSRGEDRTDADQSAKGSRSVDNQIVQVRAGAESLDGNLSIPDGAMGLVIFVHGSGSSRKSPRNQYVAGQFQDQGLATLLFDLLTPEEEEVDLQTRHLRFDIDMLARRTTAALDWISQQPAARDLKLGLFGASTGAAAALIAATERPELTGAVVSRGGRPDLAMGALPDVKAPTLLIVGQLDEQVIDLNEQALARMQPDSQKELVIVPGATHLFEEPGALEYVARLANDWFGRYLGNELKYRNKG
jgi:putative phosphoribosyl transferase